MNIRPSQCGAFIVCQIGAYPQVIPLREALALRDLYRAKATEQEAAGNAILAEHERSMAVVLSNAINEAAGFSKAAKMIVLEADV